MIYATVRSVKHGVNRGHITLTWHRSNTSVSLNKTTARHEFRKSRFDYQMLKLLNRMEALEQKRRKLKIK